MTSTIKRLILFLALVAVPGFGIGSAYADEAKSYKVVLAAVYKVGETEFQPGEYKVTIPAEGKVRFTAVRNGKAIEVEAKVETAGAKFDRTAVISQSVNGVTRLSQIQIGGSKTRIAFE